MIWTAIGLLTLIVLGLLLRPLWRASAASARLRPELASYRDQLAELDADRARGLIGDEAAATARIEIERFFAAFLEEDRPISELLTANFSFFDDNLAAHYGINIPTGATRDAQGFARVTVPPERSAGVLAKAGVLAVTSQTFPHVALNLFDMTPAEQLRALEARKIDLGFVGLPAPPTAGAIECEHRPASDRRRSAVETPPRPQASPEPWRFGNHVFWGHV